MEQTSMACLGWGSGSESMLEMGCWERCMERKRIRQIHLPRLYRRMSIIGLCGVFHFGIL